MDPTDAAPELHGTQISLRLMTPDDVDPVVEILQQPLIRRWWGAYDADRVAQELLDETDGAIVYVIETLAEEEGSPTIIGSIQYHEEPNADYRHASMDLFVSVQHHGKGVGTDAVRTLARHLIHDRKHHRLVIDPAADNEAAIRCYERVGFRRVGIMRGYERGADGSFHDGLMMDLIKDELR